MHLTSKSLDSLSQNEFKTLITQLEEGATNILYNGTMILAQKASAFIGCLIDIYYSKFIANDNKTLSETLAKIDSI